MDEKTQEEKGTLEVFEKLQAVMKDAHFAEAGTALYMAVGEHMLDLKKVNPNFNASQGVQDFAFFVDEYIEEMEKG